MGSIESIHDENNDLINNYLVNYDSDNNNNNNIKELINRIEYLEINYKKQQEEINNLKEVCKKITN